MIDAIIKQVLDTLDLVGPLDLDAITTHATLAQDKQQVARILHDLRERELVQRDKQGRYSRPIKTDTGGQTGNGDALLEALEKMNNGAGKVTIPDPTAKKPKRERVRPHTLVPPTRAPRIEDLETPPPDPVETLLTQAVANAQNNLDAFMQEVGDIAACMGALIDARDRTVEALESYQHSKHRSSAA